MDTISLDDDYHNLDFNSNWNITDSTNIFHHIAFTPLKIIVFVVCCVLCSITSIGNTLIVLAVIIYKRLRTVTNLFIISLATADFLVGVFVMPFATIYNLCGVWLFGTLMCDIWVSMDVCLCTASILSLSAISIDRYLAITKPLNYSRRLRSKRLAFIMILVAWLMAVIITCPPIFGW